MYLRRVCSRFSSTSWWMSIPSIFFFFRLEWKFCSKLFFFIDEFHKFIFIVYLVWSSLFPPSRRIGIYKVRVYSIFTRIKGAKFLFICTYVQFVRNLWMLLGKLNFFPICKKYFQLVENSKSLEDFYSLF